LLKGNVLGIGHVIEDLLAQDEKAAVYPAFSGLRFFYERTDCIADNIQLAETR
jgi:hypothetical protein